jgi:hypothetical protein
MCSILFSFLVKNEKSSQNLQRKKMASQNQIRLVDYSKLAVAVYNVEKKYEEMFRASGGSFNPKLSGGQGWIFHMRDKKKVQDIVDSINTGKLTTPPPVVEQKQETTSIIMELMKRVEKLEAEVSRLKSQSQPIVVQVAGATGVGGVAEEIPSPPPEEILPPVSSKGMIRRKKP